MMRPDVEPGYAARAPGSGPGPARSRLSPICLFAGLTGLTSMLFLAGWTESRLPGGGIDPSAAVLGAALLTVSALFAVAWLWPVRATSRGRRTDRK